MSTSQSIFLPSWFRIHFSRDISAADDLSPFFPRPACPEVAGAQAVLWAEHCAPAESHDGSAQAQPPVWLCKTAHFGSLEQVYLGLSKAFWEMLPKSLSLNHPLTLNSQVKLFLWKSREKTVDCSMCRITWPLDPLPLSSGKTLIWQSGLISDFSDLLKKGKYILHNWNPHLDVVLLYSVSWPGWRPFL